MLDKRTRAILPRVPTRLLLVAIYFAVVVPALMYFNVGLVPDVLILVLLGAAVVVGQARLFVRDWGVFLLVVLVWQQTGPVARWANFPIHLRELVAADRWIMQPFLHGALPQVWLQRHLYHYGGWQWYDIVCVVVYGLHFPEPLIVGFVIWMRDRALFRRFAVAFLTLAGIAFIIYILYPAAPPWMAGDRFHRAIPHLHNIFDDFNYHVLTLGLGHHYTYVINVDYNKTAAMPSLHAAFPLLSALYLRKTFGRWGLVLLGYGAVVWFAVVYMAEHWIVDVFAGLLCTALAYALVEGVARSLAARRATRPAPVAAAVPEIGRVAASSRRPINGR